MCFDIGLNVESARVSCEIANAFDTRICQIEIENKNSFGCVRSKHSDK